MEIVLLRHGKPKVELSGYLSAMELKKLVVDYALSSITDVPIEKLKIRFSNHYIICSDLPRSIESAKKLSLKNIHISDALYRETDIPHYDRFFLKLPATLWLILLRIMWRFGFSQNGESFLKAKNRSKQAAEDLITQAKKNKKIIVVGHGLMNRLIGKELEKKGWCTSERVGKRYWEYRSYTLSSNMLKTE